MKNTTTLRSVVETPDEKAPLGATNDPLEQLLAEPAPASPKARKRGKLAPATAALPDDLVEVQERLANPGERNTSDPFAADHDTAIVKLNTATGVLELEQPYFLPSGEESMRFPCLTEGFGISDGSTNTSRRYEVVQWNPEVRKYVHETYGAARGEALWHASLDYYDMLADGLWVIERPLSDDDAPSVKSGGGGSGGGRGGKGGGGGRKPPTWLQVAATPVRIIGLVKDERGNYFLELSYFQIDATASRWETTTIPMEQLHDENTGSAWKALKAKGLMLGSDRKAAEKFRRMVTDYYSMVSANPAKYLQTGLSKPGWHTVEKPGETPQRVYVAPGFTTHPAIRYTGSTALPWSKAGDADTYMRRMALMLKANPVVALVCGFTVAGTLASEFSQIDHCPMWSLLGESSIGKSLAAQTAASMRGYHVSLVKNMDATSNALKERMRSFNGVGGAIDEIGSGDKMDLREKIQALYQWGSGDVKERMGRNGVTGRVENDTKEGKSHYTLLLTGEEAFVDMSSVPGGNQVRLAQMVFNHDNPLWHSIGCNADAEEWRGFINKNYGHLLPNLVHLVSKHMPRYQAAYQDHWDTLTVGIEDPKERRKANAWALALTGVTLLADELHSVMDEDGQDMPGFTHQDLLTVREHAKRILTTELDTTPIQSESVKYMDFLEGLPTLYAADLYTGSVEELRGSPKGMHVVQGKGANKEHSLYVITTDFDRMCGGKVDKTRLLRWAQEAGILQTVKEKNGTDAKGNPKIVVRQSQKVTILNGRPVCYKFVWKETVPPVIHPDIDFNT